MNKWLKINDDMVNVSRLNALRLDEWIIEGNYRIIGQYTKEHYIIIALAKDITISRDIMKAIIIGLEDKNVTIIDVKKLVEAIGGEIPHE